LVSTKFRDNSECKTKFISNKEVVRSERRYCNVVILCCCQAKEVHSDGFITFHIPYGASSAVRIILYFIQSPLDEGTPSLKNRISFVKSHGPNAKVSDSILKIPSISNKTWVNMLTGALPQLLKRESAKMCQRDQYDKHTSNKPTSSTLKYTQR
jgi:hypothetical protein